MTTATASVWDDLVGQRPTIEVLKHAAAGVGRPVQHVPVDEVDELLVGQRAVPLLELLRWSLKKKKPITWGV